MSSFAILHSLGLYSAWVFSKTVQLSHKLCKEDPRAEDSPLKTIPACLCRGSTENSIVLLLDSLCLKLMGQFY